jgi:hypothetical protein
MTQARVVRYYNNMRWVYELQAAVRRVKRDVNPAEPGPTTKPKEHKNDTSKEPEQKQERNYSETENHLILACAPSGPSPLGQSVSDPSVDDLPVVPVTTYRRFV